MTAIDQTPPFKSILLPLNHEQISASLVQFAGRVAELYDISLTLLFVLELPGHNEGAGFASETPGESEQRVKKLVDDEIRPQLGKAVVNEIIIRNGKAADVIIATADDLESDVIVMGARGKTGLTHLIMGSVTEKVVHLTNRPVLTFPVR